MTRAIYCGDHTALTTAKWGDLIYVDTRDLSLAPHIMMLGDWEPWVTDCMAQLLQRHKGCTFYDVGANFGWFSLLATRLGAARVFAFEPNPRLAELFLRSMTVNARRDRVILEQVAVGEKIGKAHLVVTNEMGGGHIEPAYRLREVDPRERPPGPYEQAMREVLDKSPPICDVVPLDEFQPDWAGIEKRGECQTCIIKIDVEGYEPQVLAGAREILRRKPILFIEHHRDEAHREMFRNLQAQGYDLQHIQHTGHTSKVLSLDEAAALVDAETVLCVPEGTNP